MWKAYLDNIQENTTPSDTVIVNIRFEHEDGRLITKGYSLQASTFKDVSVFKDFAAAQIQELSTFDEVVENIKQYIGKEII
jgi:hypothetical protein